MVKIFTKLIVFVIFGFLPLSIFAATMAFSQPATSYAVGQTFSLSIYANTADQAMNAASGVVTFPADKLEVVSLSKNNSVLSLWAQEPSFSNSLGTMSFEGIVPNPGFTGSVGKIITVTFRAKATGQAKLFFSSSSILANDGVGTNILTGQGTATFNISSAESEVIPLPKKIVEKCGILPELDITSSTNKPDTWVSSRDSSFSWILPDNVTLIQTSLSSKVDSVPSVNYVTLISKKDLVNIPDGILYFSLRYEVDDCWSTISRYKIKIDTVSPTDLTVKDVLVNNDKELALELFAKDALSGIERYEISVDDEDTLTVLSKDLVFGQYLLNFIPAGKHDLKVKAFDFANNESKEVSLAVDIPIGDLPIIDNIKDQIVFKNFKIKGWIGENTIEANLYIKGQFEEPLIVDIGKDIKNGFMIPDQTKINSNILPSDFVWSGQLKTPGSYQVWLETIDNNGIERVSLKTDFNVLPITSLNFIGMFSKFLNMKIVLIILLIGIILLFLGILRHLLKTKKLCIKKPYSKIDIENIKVLTLMENEVKGYLEILKKAKKKRSLTEEENFIFKGLKKDLSDIENLLSKEVKNIEKS